MAEWKPVSGYEGFYEVSDEGQIKSLSRMVNHSCRGKRLSPGRIMKPVKIGEDYLAVDLCKNGIIKKHLVHRIVAKAFVPNPLDLPQVNHKDENKHNNAADNLEWCTARDNTNYGTANARRAEKLRISKCKPVAQILNGTVVKVFPSTISAKEVADPGHIGACALGKRKTAGGFSWKYV